MSARRRLYGTWALIACSQAEETRSGGGSNAQEAGGITSAERLCPTVYEVLDALPEAIRKGRERRNPRFEDARTAYFEGRLEDALLLLRALHWEEPEDGAVGYYLGRVQSIETGGATMTAVAGVEIIDSK